MPTDKPLRRTFVRSIVASLSTPALVACANGPTPAPGPRFAAYDPPSDALDDAALRVANERVPPEIARIRDGAVATFVGGFINDGLMNWSAFDARRRLFVNVAARLGPRFDDALPGPDRLGPHQYVRRTDAAGMPRREFVTLLPATPAQAQAFAALANALVATPPDAGFPPMPTDTLVAGFALLADGRTVDGRSGAARRDVARAIERFVDDALRPSLTRAYGR